MRTISLIFAIIFIGSTNVVFANGFSIAKDEPLQKTKPYENPELFEGDMLFPVSSQPTERGVLRRGSTVAWTNGIVPYEIQSGYASAQEAFIIATMQKMERLIAVNNSMCVQFRPRIVSDPYYITIVNGYGCSSYVGQNTGVTMTRTVTLQHPGCIYEGIIMHELLHALGFYHEQSRPDRDSYVRVNYANIQSGMAHNFDKYDNTVVNTQNTPYDYASVMHYETDAFSINGLPTIEPLQSGVTIGQRYNMSTIDIQEVRLFYNCSLNGVTFPTVPTTTSVNLYTTNTTISSTWTTTSPTYTRYGASLSNYYYEAFRVTVPSAGSYVFTSISSIDTYGYMYSGNFSSTSTFQNLINSDDDSGGNSQFRFTVNLQPNTIYILVATTYGAGVIGPYTIVASGLARVNMTRNNQTSSQSINSTTSTVPPTTISSMINSTYSSTLTISHPTFNRNGASSMFYYEALQLTVSAAGSYRLRSVSIVDTYGYLYLSSFFPLNVATNLIAQDDDSAGSVQFLLVYTLQPGTTYVLVFTTFNPSTTTAFSVIGSGPGLVRFNRSSVISTTSSIGTTSSLGPTSSLGSTSSIRTTSAQTTATSSRNHAWKNPIDMLLVFAMVAKLINRV